MQGRVFEDYCGVELGKLRAESRDRAIHFRWKGCEEKDTLQAPICSMDSMLPICEIRSLKTQKSKFAV